jgi:hypothetical protein
VTVESTEQLIFFFFLIFSGSNWPEFQKALVHAQKHLGSNSLEIYFYRFIRHHYTYNGTTTRYETEAVWLRLFPVHRIPKAHCRSHGRPVGACLAHS